MVDLNKKWFSFFTVTLQYKKFTFFRKLALQSHFFLNVCHMVYCKRMYLYGLDCCL
jgi:hypothetical protein